ncbi:MAG: hypothetical protein LBP88_01680 [Treponema sp.]|nr:hypothetical protein [Treponema sp.]
MVKRRRLYAQSAFGSGSSRETSKRPGEKTGANDICWWTEWGYRGHRRFRRACPYGLEGIPKDWLETLAGSRDIRRLAGAMAKALVG